MLVNLRYSFLSLIFFGLMILAGCTNSRDSGKTSDKLNPCENCIVMFYNVENLFDTVDDPAIEDEEFLPEGKKQWTPVRYEAKLDSLARVISAAGALPIIAGLSEVENETVINDLVNRPLLAAGDYKIVHENSRDNRGIDVALIYRPAYFTYLDHQYVYVDISAMTSRPTRDILHVTGLLPGGDTLHVFVNHWPSRYGGQEQSEPRRMRAASTLRTEVDAILDANAMANILIMGDFNDYPDNISITDSLGASGNLQAEATLYNLMARMHSEGKGSYSYRGEWGFLDQIIVSKALLNGSYPDVDTAATQPLKKDWMLFTSKKTGDQSPNRTYAGAKYTAGYSDHLPVYTRISGGQ